MDAGGHAESIGISTGFDFVQLDFFRDRVLSVQGVPEPLIEHAGERNGSASAACGGFHACAGSPAIRSLSAGSLQHGRRWRKPSCGREKKRSSSTRREGVCRSGCPSGNFRREKQIHFPHAGTGNKKDAGGVLSHQVLPESGQGRLHQVVSFFEQKRSFVFRCFGDGKKSPDDFFLLRAQDAFIAPEETPCLGLIDLQALFD